MKPPFLPFTGHDLLAVERFQDDTRHMIEFQVLSENSPYGQREQYVRLFLNEESYARAFEAHESGTIRILKHAYMIEGHIILPDKPKNGGADEFKEENMYTVESLELALRGLYHFGIVDGDDQQTDDATEMDVLLEELDFDALLQTVRHNAQTPFCFMTCGKAAKSYAYRSEELFDQRATLLYRDITDVAEGPVSVARSTELWLLEDMTLETVSCVSVVYGSYASEYREIRGEIWETGVWMDLGDLTAKLIELCGPCFAGEIPNYEL